MTAKWFKKTRLFGADVRGRTSAPMKAGEILAIRKNLARFLKLGIAFILRYLLPYFFWLKQTKKSSV